MNLERIKEIQQGTAYPDSISVQQALLQVWNECEQQERRYSEKDLIWAIQEAYGHGRDEADDVLYHQIVGSINVILESLNKKK